MDYLLSTGLSTSSKITYIKDLILVNLKLLTNEIPYSSLGTSELIVDVEESKVIDRLTRLINSLIINMQSTNSDIEIVLTSIENKSTYFLIKLTINGTEESYAIKNNN